MSNSSQKVGILVPLNEEEKNTSNPIPSIEISKGVNVIGRDVIPISDKRLSRKHVTITVPPDGSSAQLFVVRLIASVPGYHTGSNVKKWGHMKLQSILQDCVFDKEFQNSPLVYQFSSLGSLDEKWMTDLAFSMSAGVSDDKKPLGLAEPLIVWPTVEDIRCSLEGYAAGSCVPSPQKNVEKAFLKRYWAKWKASHTGRWY